MAERPVASSVAELELALADLGRHVAYPPTPDLAARVRQEIARRPARSPSFWETWLPNQRRLALALVALIALAGAILAFSPEARTAVAERLGLRGVLIREVPALPTQLPEVSPAAAPGTSSLTADAVPAAAGTPPANPATQLGATPLGVAASPAVPTAGSSAGARLSLGQPLTLDEARARVTFQFPMPSTLGPPDEVYVLDMPPGGQVALVYYPRANVPQANTTGVGVLLTAFQGSVSSGALGKGIGPGTRLEAVRVNGGPGYWIEGDPHTFFYLDSRGQGRMETTRLAGNVLLWEQGQLTLRLESALAKDEVLRIATSIQ